MTDKPTVALLGTGTMGAGMGRNIAAAGLALRVWNRSREKAEPLAEVGSVVADFPAEAARGADVVITMLFDEESVATTMEQARPSLTTETIWVQQSTVGVEGATRLGELARDLGVRYVDAPVLGTKKPADEGNLVVLASGAAQLRDQLEPIFDAIGSRTMWLGNAGEGSRLKLAANAWVLVAVEGIAESLTLTKALGLDPRLFLEAVSGGAMDAPYVQLKGKAMLAGDFTPAFAIEGAAKDADLIMEVARYAGLDLAVIGAARDHLARALAAGHEGQDMSATYAEHQPRRDS